MKHLASGLIAAILQFGVDAVLPPTVPRMAAIFAGGMAALLWVRIDRWLTAAA